RTANDCSGLGDVLRARAVVATVQGEWAEAHSALDEALELARGLAYPYDEAKALYRYGQLHAAEGEPEQAREKHTAALAMCERLGEVLYRPHIERDLRRLAQKM